MKRDTGPSDDWLLKSTQRSPPASSANTCWLELRSKTGEVSFGDKSSFMEESYRLTRPVSTSLCAATVTAKLSDFRSHDYISARFERHIHFAQHRRTCHRPGLRGAVAAH